MAVSTCYAVCGGGTGGHIFPALAVVSALQKMQPESKMVYFGRKDGMEAKIVPERELPFYGLDVSGLSRSLSLKNIKTLWQAGMAYSRARKMLKQLDVRAILGTGGYVCGPVMAAAAGLKIPTIIHESNAVPGLTNRMLGTLATKVAVSHSVTARYFDEERVVHTGFPLRDGLNKPGREKSCELFGLDKDKKTVFIFPGSLAARKINKSLIEMLPKIKRHCPEIQLLWMTGKADYPSVKKACEETQVPAAVAEFIYDVPEAFAAADLIIARAGAGTIAEISVTGTPALLVPYPFATGDHQMKNAVVLHKAGMASIIEDSRLDAKLMLIKLTDMLKKLPALTACADVWKNTYPKKAAQVLAKLLIDLSTGVKK